MRRGRKPVEVGQALARVRSKLFGVPPTAVRIARYLLLERLGEGGIGVVYAAYDPELDRKVAIKLLHTSGEDDAAEDRLALEAQAMARVNHVNVVTVHDVGRYDLRAHVASGAEHEPPPRGVFVVMELLRGCELGAWLADAARTQEAIVGTFVAAGRGIAAAHAAGLVHRDFKPGNVIVTSEGIVKVLDFGLARVDDSLLDGPAGIVGTPAYMAPEQHRGETPDPSSDQFSFCVALAEALLGRRPYDGGSLAELLAAKMRGPTLDATRMGRLPPSLRRVLVRGLDPEPARRYPSMQALLDELRPRTRGRIVPLAIAGVACVALVAALRSGTPATCPPAAERLAGVWDDARRTSVADALASTGVLFAADTAERVTAGLDAYTQRWVDARDEACRATIEDGGQDPEAMAHTLTCLDRKLRRVDELARVLEDADADATRHAVDAVATLEDPTRCRAFVDATLPRDEAELARILAVDDELARVEALVAAGRYADAGAAAEALVDRAAALGHPRSHVETLRMLGGAQRLLGRHDAAKEALFQGVLVAKRGGLPSEAARCLAGLAIVEADARMDLAQAQRWVELGQAELTIAGDTPLVRAEVETAQGLVRLSQGRPDAARESLSSALSTMRDELGEHHPRVAQLYGMLARAHHEMGEHEAAIAQMQSARDIAAAALGRDHPSVAAYRISVAMFSIERGWNEAVAREYALAVRQLGAALGDAHPDVLRAHNNLGLAMYMNGQYAEALEHLTAVLERKEATRPPTDPSIAATLNNVGATLGELGRYDEALAYHERALAIRRAALGEAHPETAMSQVNLGATLLGLGRPREAEALLRAALADVERSETSDGVQLGEALYLLSEALVDLGRADEAADLSRRAVGLLERSPRHLGDARLALARAIASSDPAAAHELITEAKAAWGDGPGHTRRHERAEALARQLVR